MGLFFFVMVDFVTSHGRKTQVFLITLTMAGGPISQDTASTKSRHEPEAAT